PASPSAAPARCVSLPWRLPAGAATRDVSLDDLVGAGEDRWRHRQAERLGAVEIDHQLERGRLLDRQIGRLGTLTDLPGENTESTKRSWKAGSIADEAAGRDVFTRVIHRRHCMT